MQSFGSIHANSFVLFKMSKENRVQSNSSKMGKRVPYHKNIVNVSANLIPMNDRNKVAEKLNGRLAMLGFIAGSGNEIVNGVNYIDQLESSWPYVLGMSLVIGFATLKTRDIDVSEKAPFTTPLETLNGRLAMMGILAKFIYDSNVLGF